MIDAAVTDDVSAAPMPYVPAVTAENSPTWVFAVAPVVENVNAPEFVFDPDDAAFHDVDCRAYPPPVASFAPVVPGDAVCSDVNAIRFVGVPDASRPFSA